jgi:putative DNA primase/helicase
LILQGARENGNALTTDGLVPALGSYPSMASSKLFRSTKGSEHSTEMADLRGRRLLIAEELTEGRSIDVAALKRISDVGTIKARYIRQDNMEFKSVPMTRGTDGLRRVFEDDFDAPERGA